jgi:transcriptional regulator with XRE-family HTH domain
MTLAELADKARLGRAQLSRFENGHLVPTLSALGDVLAALDCGLPELYRALQLVRRQQRVLLRPKMAPPLPN